MPNESLSPVDRQLLFISEIGKDDTDMIIDHFIYDRSEWNTKFDNTSLPNVSSKMKIDRGYFVATDDIDSGIYIVFI